MKWNKEKIDCEIMLFVDEWQLDRMPTVSDLLKQKRGDLCNAITRNGGFEYFAKRLKLKTKNSETKLGKKFEEICVNWLKKIFNFKAVRMTTRFPYDILVEDCVKVDVKCSNLYRGKNGNFYAFNLESENIKSDILILYCLNDKQYIVKTYIVPSVVVQGKKQISIGEQQSKYDIFENRITVLADYLLFYKNIKLKYKT